VVLVVELVVVAVVVGIDVVAFSRLTRHTCTHTNSLTQSGLL